jgi:hypothetical protein
VRNAGIVGLLELKTLNCARNVKLLTGIDQRKKKRRNRIEKRIRVIGSRLAGQDPEDPH